jgi:hypothetical protein
MEQAGAAEQSPSVASNEQVVLAARRNTERASKSALLTFVAAALLGMACLIVALLDLAYLIGVGGVPTPERADAMNERASLLANLGWLAFVVGTGAFTRWNTACLRAASLSGSRPRPAAGFALFRPYTQLRALDESLDPDRVDVPPRPDASGNVDGYRAAAAEKLAPSRVGPAPLLAWWLLWLACTGIIVYRWMATVSWMTAKELDSLASAANVGAMVLAGIIVLRMTRRLAERTRRMFPR